MLLVADGLVARRYEVTGRVQGVGFRDFTYRIASQLGLTGTVRNTDSGAVEIVARGRMEALDRLEIALNQGPPAAQVLELHREDLADATPSGDFRIVR